MTKAPPGQHPDGASLARLPTNPSPQHVACHNLTARHKGGHHMRHHITAALATALILTATACTSSGSDDKPDTAKSAVSAKLGPKLEDVTDTDKAICNEVGDKACAEHLTDIAMAITDVEQAIDEAGGAGVYPRSTRQVEKINDAVDAYTEHECLGDENAGVAGSPCPDDARTIMAGGAALPLALEADEAKAG